MYQMANVFSNSNMGSMASNSNMGSMAPLGMLPPQSISYMDPSDPHQDSLSLHQPPPPTNISPNPDKKPRKHKKTLIQRINNDKHRQSTFTGRKNGIMRKAIELSVLCDCDIALIIFTAENDGSKMHIYSSSNLDQLLDRYQSATIDDYFRNDDLISLDNLKPGCIPKKKRPHEPSSVDLNPLSIKHQKKDDDNVLTDIGTSW